MTFLSLIINKKSYNINIKVKATQFLLSRRYSETPWCILQDEYHICSRRTQLRFEHTCSGMVLAGETGEVPQSQSKYKIRFIFNDIQLNLKEMLQSHMTNMDSLF